MGSVTWSEKKSLLSSYEQFISKKFKKINQKYENILKLSEFKLENTDRPNKGIIYPIAILLLIIFGYFNSRRKE